MRKKLYFRLICAVLILFMISVLVSVAMADEKQEKDSDNIQTNEYIKVKVLSVDEVDGNNELIDEIDGNNELNDEIDEVTTDNNGDVLQDYFNEIENQEGNTNNLTEYGYNFKRQVITAEVLEGKLKGDTIQINNMITGNLAYDFHVSVGNIILVIVEEEEGNITNAYMVDFVRDKYINLLIIVFVILLIIIGGYKGIKTCITLFVTLILVFKVLLPLLLNGYNPVLVTIFVSSLITIIVMLTVGGLNVKSFTAIFGTLLGVCVAGLIALIIGSSMKLTGLSGEEARMLQYIPQGINFNFQGLLFAGIIIGALGAVMDVAMSISSSIYEIGIINPEMSPLRLIKSGLNVGRDIMGTMSNTLILAYTGSSIQLLLLFMAYNDPLKRIVNMDLIATEIVRAIGGSIGLVLTVPFTAILAGILIGRQRKSKKALKDGESIALT